MTDVTFAVAAVLWGVLPGLLLVRALRLEGSLVEHLAAAPGLSLALVAFSAYAAELIGWPVRPLPVAGVVAGLCLLALGSRRLGTRRRQARSDTPPAGGMFADPRPALAPWLVLLLPFVVFAQLEPVTAFLLVPPTMHDGLDHANWFRLIVETGSLDPHVLLAPPLAPDGSPGYYPYGMHAVLALVAQTTTLDPMVVLMRGLMLTSAVLPLSVYALVALVSGRGWPAMTAAAASLMFWWLPYQVWGWGGYPLLAGAVAALPVSRLALAAARNADPGALAAALACGVGLLTIHPSQALAALVISTTVSVTWAVSRMTGWRTAVPFVAGLVIAGAGLAFGASLAEPIAAFMSKADAVGTSLAGDPRYAWPVGVYTHPNPLLPPGVQVTLSALYLAGVVFAIWHRRLWPFLALHLAGAALVFLSPLQTSWTSLWYHAPERIWYLQYASLPALAAFGVAAVVAALGRLFERWRPFDWNAVLWPAAVGVLFVTVYQPFAAAASRQLWLYGNRNEHLTFADARVLADFAWIREHVPADAVLFNAPADWGLPLPFTGRRTVFWSGGYAIDPSINWNQLLSMLRAGEPHASQAASELDRLGIRYVYAAYLDPVLEAEGRLPLHGAMLEGAVGLEPLYASATATVWRVRETPDGWLGIRNSDRISYHGFTDVEGDPGREWRWTADSGRVRIRPAGGGGGPCFLRVLGPPVDTVELRVNGDVLTPTGRGFLLASALATADFFDVIVRRADAPAVSLPPDQPPPIGVRITDIALLCAGGS